MKVLVIDDDRCIREALGVSISLQFEPCQVIEAADGETGLELFFQARPDAIVLDIGLPGMSGIDVLQQVKPASDIPVIMLSAHEDEADIVRALEIGADDYIKKPCSYLELTARLKAVLRRADLAAPNSARNQFSVAGLTIQFASHNVELHGRPISLTNTEYRLLYHLVRNAGFVMSHSALLQRAWGSESYGTDVVRVYVSRLRAKIEQDPDSPRYILTKPGVGYLFANGETIADVRDQEGNAEIRESALVGSAGPAWML
ncbi:MAG: two component transcriptional regulator, winged helix family [Chloroflexi bacterium]|nr:two component transcriptional regulator, winged helix family [Chloroflexota bacterium]